jgi:hypothetical protein
MSDADAVEQFQGAGALLTPEAADQVVRPGPVSTFVSTLMRGMRLNCWKICPTSERRVRISRGRRAATSRPATVTRPAVMGANPVRLRIRVDFPDPEAPRRATISPGCSSRFTPSSTLVPA